MTNSEARARMILRATNLRMQIQDLSAESDEKKHIQAIIEDFERIIRLTPINDEPYASVAE